MKIIPPLKLYLSQRYFVVRSSSELSFKSPILAGVPQGAALFPTVYNLYTANQPTHSNTIVTIYAGDQIIYATHSYPIIASSFMQNHLNLLSTWYSCWRIEINDSKSIHTVFTPRQGQSLLIFLNNKQIPTSNTVKYLGLSHDKNLKWSKN